MLFLGDILLIHPSAEHTSYWSGYPGRYEHWRFGDGFVKGWDDAYLFFESIANKESSVPELGFKGAWAQRRTEDHGSGLWEFSKHLLVCHVVTSYLMVCQRQFME